ncbi:MAG: ribosomal protein L7/L12 [Bdellovibrionales bacterium]|nr:ribosomal protein L7/L12 [Bdellovibrionales bacterium]
MNNIGDVPQDVIVALERGSKIEGIKLLREHRGIGLKEAKEAVEAFLASRPDIQTRMNESSAQNAKGGLKTLLTVVAILTALFFLFNSK